jgi:hypothetical protein
VLGDGMSIEQQSADLIVKRLGLGLGSLFFQITVPDL